MRKILLLITALLISTLLPVYANNNTADTNSFLWRDVYQIVAGALISIAFVVWMEYIRQPSLRIIILPPAEINLTPNHPAQHIRSLRLAVRNMSLPWWFKWLSRLPARCSGTISFHALDGQNIFGRVMQIRWINSPEPLPITAQLGGQILAINDPVRLTPELNREVFVSDEEIFDVAARFNEETECYGWSNENYFSNPIWRNPNWQLEQGIYLVRVEIRSSGKRCKQLFRLINMGPVNAFRLTSTLPNDPKI